MTEIHEMEKNYSKNVHLFRVNDATDKPQYSGPCKIIINKVFQNVSIMPFNKEIIDSDRKEGTTKLIIFLSETNQKYCYEYSKQQSGSFRCTACFPLKTCSAYLVEDENGTKHVNFNCEDHICEPRIYDPKKYGKRPKCNETQFEVFHNTKGAPNSRLLIFDSENHNYGYDYRKTDRFNCSGCQSLKKRVFAKLLIDDGNGQQYIELSKIEHICKKLNYSEIGRIIYSLNFVIEIDSSGKQTITTKHLKDKNRYYKFSFDNDLQAFYCTECRKKNMVVTAKICNKNEKEFLLLGFDHFCNGIVKL